MTDIGGNSDFAERSSDETVHAEPVVPLWSFSVPGLKGVLADTRQPTLPVIFAQRNDDIGLGIEGRGINEQLVLVIDVDADSSEIEDHDLIMLKLTLADLAPEDDEPPGADSHVETQLGVESTGVLMPTRMLLVPLTTSDDGVGLTGAVHCPPPRHIQVTTVKSRRLAESEVMAWIPGSVRAADGLTRNEWKEIGRSLPSDSPVRRAITEGLR